MKKLVWSTILLLALTITFVACRDTKKADSVEEAIENAGDAIEDATNDAADAAEGAFEETGKAIDDVVKETKEAGEAAKEAVDKIEGN